jgi:hypothetical protein
MSIEAINLVKQSICLRFYSTIFCPTDTDELWVSFDEQLYAYLAIGMIKEFLINPERVFN